MAIIAATLGRIKSDPLFALGGKDRVNEQFARSGHVWRDRVLDPAATLGLFILQVLHGNTAIGKTKGTFLIEMRNVPLSVPTTQRPAEKSKRMRNVPLSVPIELAHTRLQVNSSRLELTHSYL